MAKLMTDVKTQTVDTADLAKASFPSEVALAGVFNAPAESVSVQYASVGSNVLKSPVSRNFAGRAPVNPELFNETSTGFVTNFKNGVVVAYAAEPAHLDAGNNLSSRNEPYTIKFGSVAISGSSPSVDATPYVEKATKPQYLVIGPNGGVSYTTKAHEADVAIAA